MRARKLIFESLGAWLLREGRRAAHLGVHLSRQCPDLLLSIVDEHRRRAHRDGLVLVDGDDPSTRDLSDHTRFFSDHRPESGNEGTTHARRVAGKE